jgi:hypothetical protein
MSVLSLLSGVVLAALIYGFSFLPSATLTRPDDDAGLEVVDDGGAPCGGDCANKNPKV